MKSIWCLDSKLPSFNSLNQDITTKVCVIGGGLCGLLTLYLLSREGIDCILIEAKTIASGVTPNTSAKITCQHGPIYSKIINQFNLKMAQQYAKANSQALNMYHEIIQNNKIDCNLETIPTYLYTTKEGDVLETELVAMESVGLKGSLTNQTTLPFEIVSALKMDNQAQFNPLAFLSFISANLPIYERTKALAVEDNVVTTSNGKITADHIVVTTHFPFINAPGYYFMRMHQGRSYMTALKDAGTLDGAYLGIDDISYSFRTYKDMILLGGCGHRTGENEQGGKYATLTSKAREFYPHSQQVCYWATQDCMTHDGVPYIGRYSNRVDNLYVATGFNKWGMTSSMVSAMILRDIIMEKENPWQEVFSPQRSNLTASAKKLAIDGIEAVTGLIKQALCIPSANLDEVEIGHGGIIEYNGEKIGVYKRSANEVYTVSTKCPHLGCQLTWNPDDLSWDCPCHGSRFDYKGNILNNPAQKELDHED